MSNCSKKEKQHNYTPKLPESIYDKYIKQEGLGRSLKIRIPWQSIGIPIAALIILTALLLPMIASSSHIICNCYGICAKQKSDAICQCDSNKNGQNRDLSPNTQVGVDVAIQSNSECLAPAVPNPGVEKTAKHTEDAPSDIGPGPMIILWMALAVILLLTLIFMLKYLVPYWTRIAEINERQNGKIIRLVEEEMEFEQLAKRSQIGILVKQANATIDEEAKEGGNSRNIERMKQEYQSHLADVALEMIKAVNKSKENTK